MSCKAIKHRQSNQSKKMMCEYKHEDSEILIDPSSIVCYSVDKNNKIIACDMSFTVENEITKTGEIIPCSEVSHDVPTDTLSIGTQNVSEFKKVNCCKSLEAQANFMQSLNMFLSTEKNHVDELQSYKENYRRSAKLEYCFSEEQELSNLTQRSLLSHRGHNSTKCDDLELILRKESHVISVNDQERESNVISFNDMYMSQKETLNLDGGRNKANYEVGSMEFSQPVCDKNQMDKSLMYSLTESNTSFFQTEDVPYTTSLVHHPKSTFDAVIDKENEGGNLAKSSRNMRSEHWTIVLKRKSCELKEGEVCQGDAKKIKIDPIKLVKNKSCSGPSKKSIKTEKNNSCLETSLFEPITKTSSSYSKQNNTELKREKCFDASLISMSLAKGAEKEATNQSSRKISISESICASDQHCVSVKSQEEDISKKVGKSSNMHIKNIGKAMRHNLKDFLNVGSNFTSVRSRDEHNSQDEFATLRDGKNQDEHEFPSPKCKKKALSESIIKPFVPRLVEAGNCNNPCNENVKKGSKVLVPKHLAFEKNRLSTSETKLLCQDVENGSERISINPLEEVISDFMQCPLNNAHTFHDVPKQTLTEVGVCSNGVTDSGNQDLKNIGRENMMMSENTVLQNEELNISEEALCPIGEKLKESSMEEVHGRSVMEEVQELEMPSFEEKLVWQDDGGKKEIIPKSSSGEVYNFVGHYVCDGVTLFTIPEDSGTKPEISYHHLIDDGNENYKGIKSRKIVTSENFQSNSEINKALMSGSAILSVEKQVTVKKMIVYQDNEKLNSNPPKSSVHGNLSDTAPNSLDNEPKLCSLPKSSLVQPLESCKINESNQEESLIAFKDADKTHCLSIYASSAESFENSTHENESEVDETNSISLDKTSCGDQKNSLVFPFPEVVQNKPSEYEDEICEEDDEYGCVYRKLVNGFIYMTVRETSRELESSNVANVASKEQFSSVEDSLPSTDVESENEGVDHLSGVAPNSCESGLAISSVYSISNFLSNDEVQKNLDVDTYPNKSSNDFEISSSEILNCDLSVFNDTSKHTLPVPASMNTLSINFAESNLGSDKASTIVSAEHELDTFTLQNLIEFSNKPVSLHFHQQEKNKIIESESCTVEAPCVNNESTKNENCMNKNFVDQDVGSISHSSKSLNPGNEIRNRGSYISRACDDPNIKLIPKEPLFFVTMPSNSVLSSENSIDENLVDQNALSSIDGSQNSCSGNKERERVTCVSRLNDDPNITLVPESSSSTIIMPCSSHLLNGGSCDLVNQDASYVAGYKQKCNLENGGRDREPVTTVHDHTYANLLRFHQAKVGELCEKWSQIDNLCHLSSVTPTNDVKCCPSKNRKLQILSSLPAKQKPSSLIDMKNQESNQVLPEQTEHEEVMIIGVVMVKADVEKKKSNQVLQKQTQDEDVQIIQVLGTGMNTSNRSCLSTKKHEILAENIQPWGNFKCLEPFCICCQYLETKHEFIMYNTGVLSKINFHITCKTTNVIFIAECTSCKKQYFCFSEHLTLEQCLKRILACISNKQHTENEEDCVKHFKQEGHKGDIKIYGIDANIRSRKELEERTNFWLNLLFVVQID